jgi:hypothetical protein
VISSKRSKKLASSEQEETRSLRWIKSGLFRLGFCWDFFTDETLRRLVLPGEDNALSTNVDGIGFSSMRRAGRQSELQMHLNPVSGRCNVFDSEIALDYVSTDSDQGRERSEPTQSGDEDADGQFGRCADLL